MQNLTSTPDLHNEHALRNGALFTSWVLTKAATPDKTVRPKSGTGVRPGLEVAVVELNDVCLLLIVSAVPDDRLGGRCFLRPASVRNRDTVDVLENAGVVEVAIAVQFSRIRCVTFDNFIQLL